MKDNGAFSRFIEEFGAAEEEKEDEIDEVKGEQATITKKDAPAAERGAQAPLMSQEEREIGSVSFSVYSRYLSYAGGSFWALVVLGLLTLQQSSTGAL